MRECRLSNHCLRRSYRSHSFVSRLENEQHQPWQVRMVTWDVERWLPVDPVDTLGETRTAMNSAACRNLVFNSRLFVKFVAAILEQPCDIIVS